MSAHPAGRRARPVMLAASIGSLLTALWLTAAGPTFACSCVQPQPMAAYGTGEYAVFSGTTGPSDARGVPVRVARWFVGPGPAPIVYLAASSFGDSAACGTNLPAAGTDWIWVAWIGEAGELGTGLCNPQGQLGTPEGDALLADATTTFGGGAPPGTTATDPPATAPEPPAVSQDVTIPILLGTVGLGLVALIGVAVIARRRNPDVRGE